MKKLKPQEVKSLYKVNQPVGMGSDFMPCSSYGIRWEHENEQLEGWLSPGELPILRGQGLTPTWLYGSGTLNSLLRASRPSPLLGSLMGCK